jgi:RsiW-degrading membrane proteinase PrsW (M82 family)
MGLGALIVPMIPGVLWLWVFYRTDWYEPEPKRLVLATYGLGILAILPAFAGERLAGWFFPFLSRLVDDGAAQFPVWPALMGCFLVVGPCEEISKFLAVRLFVYDHEEFDEPLDGVIYAAAAALGFASLENVLYVTDWHTGHVLWGTLGVRSLFALPGHVIFAATWGYALGRKKFDRRYPLLGMVLAASLLHGLYDFLLLYPPTRPLVFLYMSLMVPVLVRQIRLLRARSPFAPAPQPVAAADEREKGAT